LPSITPFKRINEIRYYYARSFDQVASASIADIIHFLIAFSLIFSAIINSGAA